MTPEALGAFIDAVYAIAVTILALEIPGARGQGFDAIRFIYLLSEYGIAFAILFAFWMQHRRLNARVEHLSRAVLWLNGCVMLLVCLIPRATTLVFAYGGDVTVVDFEAELVHGASELAMATLADGMYVAVVFLADAILLLLTCIVITKQADAAAYRLRRMKMVASALLTACLALSIALPVPNRYFALLLPLVLFFEEEVTTWIESRRPSPTARAD